MIISYGCNADDNKLEVSDQNVEKLVRLNGVVNTNLVINSSFEDNGMSPWTSWNSFSVVNHNQKWGSYCAMLGANNCSAEQVITGLKPNTTYNLSAYAKVINSGEKVFIGVKDFGGIETNVHTTNNSYELLTVSFTTGTSNSSAKIYLWRNEEGSGGAYGDNFVISEPNKTRLFWFHWNSEALSDSIIAVEAPRRKLVALNAWDYSYISKFKAANPEIEVFVYKDLSSTRSYAVNNGVDDFYLPCGVGYVYANTNHPEWFMTDDDGNRLIYDGYPGHYQMDIGNSAYQNYWTNQVKNELVAKGWDGVFMDNALVAADMYHIGVFPKEYKNDLSIQNAYSDMFTITHSALLAEGKKSIPNVSNARLYPGVWNTYLQNNDGALDEWWLVFGVNQYLSEYAEGWSAQVSEVSNAEAGSKFALVQPHNPFSDLNGFYYALASYWLVNDGNTMFSEQEILDGYGDPSPWRSAYDWDMGIPSSSFYTYSPGVFRREFSKAMVIVNANSSGSVTINLEENCLDENGINVTTVTVDALRGTILRKR